MELKYTYFKKSDCKSQIFGLDIQLNVFQSSLTKTLVLCKYKRQLKNTDMGM